MITVSISPKTTWRCNDSKKLRESKIELSSSQSTQINLPFVTATDAGPLHMDYALSRSKFQELTSDLLERCRKPFEQAIKDAGLSMSEIEHVILVGDQHVCRL